MSIRFITHLTTCLALCAAGTAWTAEDAAQAQAKALANAVSATKDGEETERKLAEADVPAAVLATMRTSAAGAKLGDYEAEKKAGADVYTAEFTRADGVKMEVTVAADGTLRGLEKDEDEEGDHGDAKPEVKPAVAEPAVGK